MVEIKEVTDEHFEMGQPGPDDDDEYSDTGRFLDFVMNVNVYGSSQGLFSNYSAPFRGAPRLEKAKAARSSKRIKGTRISNG